MHPSCRCAVSPVLDPGSLDLSELDNTDSGDSGSLLHDDLTVDENIEFFGGVYGLSAERLAARRDYVIRMAGLQDKRDTMTRLLAGGWKQRLARAMPP